MYMQRKNTHATYNNIILILEKHHSSRHSSRLVCVCVCVYMFLSVFYRGGEGGGPWDLPPPELCELYIVSNEGVWYCESTNC